VDALRVRALQGDPLREVPDAQREWVFRSLLKGQHLAELAARAGLSTPAEIERALARIRRWYQERLSAHQHCR
jgi:hypothetical protein